jgi:hypothetical protein
MAIPTNDEGLFRLMFGNLTREQRTSADLSILALGPIVAGLILESNFEPEKLSESAIQHLLGRLFDALFRLPIYHAPADGAETVLSGSR